MIKVLGVDYRITGENFVNTLLSVRRSDFDVLVIVPPTKVPKEVYVEIEWCYETVHSVMLVDVRFQEELIPPGVKWLQSPIPWLQGEELPWDDLDMFCAGAAGEDKRHNVRVEISKIVTDHAIEKAKGGSH